VRSTVEKTWLRLGVNVEVRLEVDSLQVTKDLIESGQAFGVLPVSAIRREVDAGRLRYAPICA
jgi:DNA-binding transcriptional LysR family regulator